MEGRKIIVQTVIGSMTQYLAQVQGMPKVIENMLTNRAKEFLWENKKFYPVNLQMLYSPIENGGRALLDIKSRNKVIRIIWLKKYLVFTDNRSHWAFIADCCNGAGPEDRPGLWVM